MLAMVLYYQSSQLTVPLKVINLFLPLVLFAHIFFVIILAFQKHRFFIVSFLLLVSSYFVFGAFFKIDSNESTDSEQDALSIMTFNVWGFNKYEWIKEPNIGHKIIEFMKEKEPDVICIQEHDLYRYKEIPNYSYKSGTPRSQWDQKSMQGIFSKYPIISEGSLDLPNSRNNIIFADILYKNDTLRIYNVHLQSYNIIPSRETFSEKESEKNYRKVTTTFQKQLEQAIIFKEHRASSPYRTIVCGDFNNTQFSNIYRLIKGDMTDSFLEAGKGFGKTYNLKGYPMRIDYILADKSFEVLSHQNFDVKLSDHYPVSATLQLKSEE